ncbi:MAG: glycosyltransferase family 2 protein [Burkholderiales bacterium]|nr:MAG: glycosyltransferase family 2 protein [Burkholderiales bacterium]
MSRSRLEACVCWRRCCIRFGGQKAGQRLRVGTQPPTSATKISNMRPSIDVVVPCYNYAHYLENCVQSVLSQEDVDVRVLIIDDVSKDNSVEVAERLAAADSRVSVLKHTVNKGLVGTANDGVIDWATAKYTLLLSADDALTQGALRRAASVMDAHPDVAVAYGMALVISDNTDMTPVDDARVFDYKIISGNDFIERACTSWCGVASPTALIRTSAQHEVGGLDPRFPQTCDMEIWLRLATRANVAALSTTQAYYRRHDANMSSITTDQPLSDLREQLETVVAVLTDWGKNLASTPRWLDVIHKRVAVQACWKAGLAFQNDNVSGGMTCLEFAKTASPAITKSAPWMRAQAKRLLGGKLVRLMRGGTVSSTHSFTPFYRGKLFGWWPTESAARSMTLPHQPPAGRQAVEEPFPAQRRSAR